MHIAIVRARRTPEPERLGLAQCHERRQRENGDANLLVPEQTVAEQIRDHVCLRLPSRGEPG